MFDYRLNMFDYRLIVDEFTYDFSDYNFSFFIFEWPKLGSLLSCYSELFFDRLGRFSNFLLLEF